MRSGGRLTAINGSRIGAEERQVEDENQSPTASDRPRSMRGAHTCVIRLELLMMQVINFKLGRQAQYPSNGYWFETYQRWIFLTIEDSRKGIYGGMVHKRALKYVHDSSMSVFAGICNFPRTGVRPTIGFITIKCVILFLN